MKKRVVHVISLLMALLMLASCSSGALGDPKDSTTAATPAPETTQAPETEPPEYDRIAELGEHDFQGAIFIISDENADPNCNTPDETLEGEIVNDAIILRDAQIAEKYNLKIQYEKDKYTPRIGALRNTVLAHEKYCDLFYGSILDKIAPLATEGLLANLCDMEALSLNENWWSPLIYENLRLGGKMYYTIGDISPISYRAPAVYYVNESLLDNYHINKNEIYDHVENGTWTLDVLSGYTRDVSTDLNEDGKLFTDDDFFGALNEDNNLTAACFAVAAGVNLCTIENDEITIDLGTEHVINAIEKLSGIISSAARSSNDELHKAFKESRAIFMMHYASSGYTRYREIDFDYMTIPLPKYDENQKSYRSMINTWTNSCVCVPVTADTDPDGIIMEAMAFWSYKNMRPVAYERALKMKGSRNARDSVMLDIIMDTRYIDFNAIMEFGDTLTPITDTLFRGQAYVSANTKRNKLAKTKADEFTQKWIGAE